MDKYTRRTISETFENVDFSIIAEVLYFDGWTSYEECGGYLIFRGIDGSLQQCTYGHSVMAQDNTNRFEPVEITQEEMDEAIREMEEARQSYDFR